ncbi:hypothetical protein ACW95P_01845 [Candidatus Mycoplasma pogonae]
MSTKPNVIVKINFKDPNKDQKEIAFYRDGGKVWYLSQDKKIWKTAKTNNELLEEFNNSGKSYLDFMKSQQASIENRAYDKSGMWSLQAGRLEEIAIKDLSKQMSKETISEKQKIWSGVISFVPEVLEQNKIFSPTEILGLCVNEINTLIKKEFKDNKHVKVLLAIHLDTDHPHIQFEMFETKPIYLHSTKNEIIYRAKGVFGKENLSDFIINIEKKVSDPIISIEIQKSKEEIWKQRNVVKETLKDVFLLNQTTKTDLEQNQQLMKLINEFQTLQNAKDKTKKPYYNKFLNPAEKQQLQAIWDGISKTDKSLQDSLKSYRSLMDKMWSNSKIPQNRIKQVFRSEEMELKKLWTNPALKLLKDNQVEKTINNGKEHYIFVAPNKPQNHTKLLKNNQKILDKNRIYQLKKSIRELKYELKQIEWERQLEAQKEEWKE